MDGGKFFNRVQSGSFEHQSMATALRVQHGMEWTIPVIHFMGITSGLEQLEKLNSRRKQKHDLDSA